MGLSTTYTKVETDYLLQKLESELVSGLKGELAISDTAPTVQGLYILSEVGTYTNLGGIVTTEGKINYAYFNGTTWSLISTSIGGKYLRVLGEVEATDGYYDDLGNFNALPSYKSQTVIVDEYSDYYATALVDGGAVYLAIYTDETGNILGTQGQGVNGSPIQYTRERLNLVTGTKKILMTSRSSLPILDKLVYNVASKSDIIKINEAGLDYDNIIGVNESSQGYWGIDGNFNAFASYYSSSFQITDETKDYYATSEVTGGAVYLAIYLDENNNVIGSQGQGINGEVSYYTREKLILPTGTRKILMTSKNVNYPKLEELHFAPMTRTKTQNLIDENFQNKWKNKKIVWFGTSIPEGGYPQVVGSLLNANVINEAIGSSMMRIGKADYSTNPLDDNYLGIQGVAWQNVLRSLSMTQVEKHYIMKNWTADARKATLIAAGYTSGEVASVKGFGELLAGNFIGDPNGSKPVDIMDAGYINDRKAYLSFCWDSSNNIESGFGAIAGKLEKYLSTEEFPDLIILDHGHNDGLPQDSNEQLTEIPTSKYNRNTFLGAMNYFCQKIFAFNPKANIIIIGHYTNQLGGTNRPVEVTQAQINFSNYWQFPLFKLWEKVPFSQSIITTNGYWDNSGIWHDAGFNGSNHYGQNFTGNNQNPRQENGVWVHDLTMKQIWMKDDLHPSSDTSGNCNNKIANIIYDFLK